MSGWSRCAKSVRSYFEPTQSITTQSVASFLLLHSLWIQWLTNKDVICNQVTRKAWEVPTKCAGVMILSDVSVLVSVDVTAHPFIAMGGGFASYHYPLPWRNENAALNYNRLITCLKFKRKPFPDRSCLWLREPGHEVNFSRGSWI